MKSPFDDIAYIGDELRRVLREVLKHSGEWTIEDAEAYVDRAAKRLQSRVDTAGDAVAARLQEADRQRREAFREASKAGADAETWAAKTVAQFLAAQDRLAVEGHFVYILWGDDPETPLYVGETRALLGRLGSHHWTKGKHVRSVQLITCQSETERKDTERRLIRHYRPPLNVLLQPYEIVTETVTDADSRDTEGNARPLQERHS